MQGEKNPAKLLGNSWEEHQEGIFFSQPWKPVGIHCVLISALRVQRNCTDSVYMLVPRALLLF